LLGYFLGQEPGCDAVSPQHVSRDVALLPPAIPEIRGRSRLRAVLLPLPGLPGFRQQSRRRTDPRHSVPAEPLPSSWRVRIPPQPNHRLPAANEEPVADDWHFASLLQDPNFPPE